MDLGSGRPVAPVLELAMPWSRDSADAPGHGRSCENFDDPSGTGGRKGEPHDVLERSGFNSIGILFLTPSASGFWRLLNPTGKDFDLLLE